MTPKEYQRRWYLKHKKEHCKRSVENARKRFKTPEGRKKRHQYNSIRWKKKTKKQRTEALRRVEQWRRQNPERAKSTTLKHHYGITFEEFLALRTRQRNRCAICRRRFHKTPHVDHDHKTKVVRGLLCTTCNLGIGMLKDCPRLLLAAAAYLKELKCQK